ncbi:MAG: phosphotransferase, partial [Solirubrobacterales bacterium]|nr:phosphotransferase [Solirubrobacterales bacterium]
MLRIDTDTPGITLTPLSYEVAIHQRLSETEIPVAPVLAYEGDGAAFTNGRPFYIRAWIDGTVEPPGLRDQGPASDGLRIAVARELVRVLGAVHALDWRGLRFDAFMRVPTSPALAAREYVELQISHLHSLDIEANPVVLECLLALRDAPPPPPSAICLTKGNLGIGDEIWVDA